MATKALVCLLLVAVVALASAVVVEGAEEAYVVSCQVCFISRCLLCIIMGCFQRAQAAIHLQPPRTPPPTLFCCNHHENFLQDYHKEGHVPFWYKLMLNPFGVPDPPGQ